MYSANKAVFFEMHRVIRHLLDTRNLDIKLEPTYCLFIDSDYAGDALIRSNVSGFILYNVDKQNFVKLKGCMGGTFGGC